MFPQDKKLVEAAISMALVVGSSAIQEEGAIQSIKDRQGVQEPDNIR